MDETKHDLTVPSRLEYIILRPDGVVDGRFSPNMNRYYKNVEDLSDKAMTGVPRNMKALVPFMYAQLAKDALAERGETVDAVKIENDVLTVSNDRVLKVAEKEEKE